MQQIIKIAEEFFKMNNIQINEKKSKLIIMNSGEIKENRKISIEDEIIQEEGVNKITRFLGVWLNCKLKDSMIRARAQETVRATIRSLNTKRMTIAQVAYINNMCIVPKLLYLLQTMKLTKAVIDKIQSPLLRIAKNKLEIASTTENSIMLHRNLGNCNSLWNQLIIKQITSLHTRLNAGGTEELVTRIRINQGLLLIGATENDWHNNPPKLCNKIWKNNLACYTMLKAKEIQITLSFGNPNLCLNRKGIRILDVLDALALEKLKLIYIE